MLLLYILGSQSGPTVRLSAVSEHQGSRAKTQPRDPQLETRSTYLVYPQAWLRAQADMPSREPLVSGTLNKSLWILLILLQTKVTLQNSPVLAEPSADPGDGPEGPAEDGPKGSPLSTPASSPHSP